MAKKPRGIIAAGHIETATAGQVIFEAGGNAIDAALAAMLTSFVAEPVLTSMGGGGFLLAANAHGKSALFDFFVQTPRHRGKPENLDFHQEDVDFGGVIQEQYIGRASTAVPGCPAGLFSVHERLGKLPLEVIAEPAIRLAKRGLVMNDYQAYTFRIVESVLLHSEEMRRVFGKEGKLLGAGDRLSNSKLADSIAWIIEEGPRVFYEGEMARRLCDDHAEHGGSLTMEDMRAYRTEIRQPVICPYHNIILLTNPAPSAGGSMICYGLTRLKETDVRSLDPKGMDYVRHLVSTMKEMDAYRYRQLNPAGNTTHISTMDAEGNVASLTTTLGGASGWMIPGTGIPTNNMLGETDLCPEGIYTWEPDTRLSSMMSPSISLSRGRPDMVLGSGGSSRIRSSILQVLVNVIDHGMSLRDAVDYPRMHWEAGKLSLEPGLIAPEDLPRTGEKDVHFWEEKNMFFGGVHALRRLADGKMIGAGDGRRSGEVLAC